MMFSRLRSLPLSLIISLVLLQSMSLHAQDDYRLPTPTGPYGVGITSFHWVDEAREETYTRDSDDRRELMVDVWYPADVPEGSETAPYMPNPQAFRDGLQSVFEELPDLKLPLEAFSELQTNSYADAPLSNAEERYPVLIFSTGFGASSRTYSGQIEELASHGYVIASVDHPYLSGAVMFPDGRVVMVETNQPSVLVETAIMSADQRFVLDQLEAMNNGELAGMFAERLDLERVGVFGHSAGGYASAETFTTDDRFKAAIVEDGEFLPAARRNGSDYPLMHMASGDFPLHMRTFNNFRGGVYNLTFDTFGHTSFTDGSVWEIEVRPNFGTVEPTRVLPVINAYILAFFNQTLNGIESPLLQGASADYPEVIFEMKAPS